jgi:endonuclease/exonuclease/phosphatase family metal-dependent hydrolase
MAKRMDHARPPDRIVDRVHDDVFTESSDTDETDLHWLGVVESEVDAAPGETNLSALVEDHETYAFTRRNQLGFADREAKGLASMPRWLPTDVADNAPRSLRDPATDGRYSLRAVLERHVDPEPRTHKLLFLNTWMLRAINLAVKIDWWTPGWLFDRLDKTKIDEWSLEQKPAIDERLVDLVANVEAAEYDIVGLCELFDPDDIARFRSEIDHNAFEIGPEARDATLIEKPIPVPGILDVELALEDVPGSGLVILTRGGDDGLPVIQDGSSGHPPAQTVFDWQGDPRRDADTFARKGVLYTEIDLGYGKIDYFVTHLFAGGSLEFVGTVLSELFGEDAGDPLPQSFFKREQLEDLFGFIDAHQVDENVTIVAGDMNITADPNDPVDLLYQELLRGMYVRGLQDVWLHRGGNQNGTKTWDESREGVTDHCSIGEDSPNYCEDYYDSTKHPEFVENDVDRIDYVFVELPHEDHSFNLDVGRPRRASFLRDTYDDLGHVSDHLGLELRLHSTPK